MGSEYKGLPHGCTFGTDSSIFEINKIQNAPTLQISVSCTADFPAQFLQCNLLSMCRT